MSWYYRKVPRHTVAVEEYKMRVIYHIQSNYNYRVDPKILKGLFPFFEFLVCLHPVRIKLINNGCQIVGCNCNQHMLMLKTVTIKITWYG